MNTRAALDIDADLSFNMRVNIATILALQKALAFAVDHCTLAVDDPIRPLAEAMLKLVKDLESSQQMLGSMFSIKMDLTNIKVPPPKTLIVEKEKKSDKDDKKKDGDAGPPEIPAEKP